MVDLCSKRFGRLCFDQSCVRLAQRPSYSSQCSTIPISCASSIPSLEVNPAPLCLPLVGRIGGGPFSTFMCQVRYYFPSNRQLLRTSQSQLGLLCDVGNSHGPRYNGVRGHFFQIAAVQHRRILVRKDQPVFQRKWYPAIFEDPDAVRTTILSVSVFSIMAMNEPNLKTHFNDRIVALVNIVAVALLFAPSLNSRPDLRSLGIVPSLVIHNIMACRVYREVKLGLLSSGLDTTGPRGRNDSGPSSLDFRQSLPMSVLRMPSTSSTSSASHPAR